MALSSQQLKKNNHPGVKQVRKIDLSMITRADSINGWSTILLLMNAIQFNEVLDKGDVS